jgi:mRNA-degrading endonuclease RelE of RelBE toxin-antitoxin system
MITFDELPEFQKDCKRLGKKYKSLIDDLKEFRNVVSVVPLGNSKHFIIITQIKVLYIVKARLFCRYLKGSSLRVIYAYFEQEQRIEFIEVYFKGDKENENHDRIMEYLNSYQN